MDIKQTASNIWLWRRNMIWGWVEAIIFTVIVLACLNLIDPHNPLFVKAGFPWPWIAPVMIIFQYGFGPGLLSASIITIVAIFHYQSGTLSIQDLQIYVSSGLALILICGLFATNWVKRLQSSEAMADYATGRLASLSSSYYMLRVSNDYLEQNIIIKPATLRSALDALQQKNLYQQDPLSLEVARTFLEILAQYCSIESLAIYRYKNKKIVTEPFVEVGSVGKLKPHDPLIKLCLEIDEVCYIKMLQVEDMSDCLYMMALPLITDDSSHFGLLVIKEIPFWILNEETLRALSILVHFFIKNTVLTVAQTAFFKVYPNCSLEFVRQLTTLASLKKSMNLESALAAVMVSKKLRPHHVIDHLKNKCRTLDAYWIIELGEYDVLITVMAFTNNTGVQGYLTRTRLFLTEDLGISIEKNAVFTRTMQLRGEDALTEMQYFTANIFGIRESM